jgi:predicted RNase H-like nuclease (RuvC/YqgF family)
MVGMDSWRDPQIISGAAKEQAIQEIIATERARIESYVRREDEVNGMNAMPTPTSESVLQQNMNYLAENIERLYDVVNRLQDRLSPILMEGSPETSEKSMGYGGNTQVSESVANLCRKTQNLYENLNYLTSRIDL